MGERVHAQGVQRDAKVAADSPTRLRTSRRLDRTIRLKDRLARGFACAGRGEDAIIEREALVKEGYHAGGWRRLVRHAAYDAIRAQPRFEALVDRLRSVADGELKGFLARPDLAQFDIDRLGEARSR